MCYVIQITAAPQILYVETSAENSGLNQMYVKVDGINLYLIPINLVRGITTLQRDIVAAKKADIVGTTHVWSDTNITARIQCNQPIAPP